LLYNSFKDLEIIKNNIYLDSDDLRLSRKYELFQTLKEYKIGIYDRKKNLRQINMYDLNNKFIKTYNNIHEVIIETNLKYNSIHRAAMGITHSTRKYIFKYIYL
jgi:UDP-glucose 6-dehydrogenase